MSEIAIKVEDINKIYKLYDRPSDRLRESLGLTKKKLYSEHYALKNISFDVKKGETVGIIGTNGSGKSTVLKIITGVLNPSGGKVEIHGRISALLELGAGFNMDYTGIENIYLNGRMIGFRKEEIDKRLEDILAFADIGDFVYQPVKTYSSGMFVRLAFAVAINIDPEILIVDEALSVGDVFFQAKCYKKFEEFKEMGKTILIVSHDLSSISKYCDRVLLLNKGVNIAEGSPKKIVDMYKKLLVHQLDTEDTAGNPEGLPKEAAAGAEAGLRENVKWKESLPSNPGVTDYGTKEAEIVDYAILDQNGMVTNTLEKGEDCAVRLRVQFHTEVFEPIFAFTIKDLRGTEITGTNSMFEGAYMKKKEKGETVTVTFRQNMNLQGGEYLLSLGCTGYKNGEFVVYHRLYDVCNINVISDRNTVGFYDMNSALEIV